MDILETIDLSFEYPERENKVLDNVKLSIKKGTFTAILGRNGSGKSTLAKHFNAILLPSGGKVYAAGFDTADEEYTYDIRRNVGMVFQNPDNQIVATTVEEDVAFGLENLGVEYHEMHERVKEALKAVDMYDRRGSAPHLLSGGQKQRVAIAGIIAMRPQVVVFDEPTAMLDPKGRGEVLQTIMSLKNEMGKTVVLITHFMEEAAQADRVVVIDKGRIIMDASPRIVLTNVEKMHSLGLDVPQPTMLCHMLREKGIDIRHDVLTVEECAECIADILRKKGQKNGID